MNVQQTLLARRTIHDYKTDPVSSELIEAALEAALHAPNHKHTHPLRFYRVGRKTRSLIADLSVELKQKGENAPIPEARREALRAKILTPDTLIVFARRISADEAVSREDYATVACAVQNFSLSLWEHGIGSKWSTGGITRHPKVYEWLGIDPDAEAIEGFVWAGIPLRVPVKPPRPALSACLFERP